MYLLSLLSGYRHINIFLLCLDFPDFFHLAGLNVTYPYTLLKCLSDLLEYLN